ncbi:hypothetical protein HK107_15365 [Parvularcula sp. ZS-1/3]|uniref:C-type lysozyme inhibitor domain-containing protein n=1 Tax=Parvularcula mediterranea TaxID=2732508 RepID=A0A7Y3RPD5_9PROT|nr:hypothetical protein [Parvularcula mediterranea]NNU17710.1 hypothetical protein [Parvularcula mediterranea]
MKNLILTVLLLLPLAACSEGTVVFLENDTRCAIDDIRGYLVSDGGEEQLVFAINRADPRAQRQVYFQGPKDATLLIRAQLPEGFEVSYDLAGRGAQPVLPLSDAGTFDCRLRSAEEF